MLRIDRAKLRSETKNVALDLKYIKDIFRESRQPRLTFKHHYLLLDLKERATILCSISAHLRGKIHKHESTLEKQFELISNSLHEFELETPVVRECACA